MQNSRVKKDTREILEVNINQETLDDQLDVNIMC